MDAQGLRLEVHPDPGRELIPFGREGHGGCNTAILGRRPGAAAILGHATCMPRIKFRIAVSDGRVTGEADATGRHLEFTGTIDENGALAGTVTGWETIAVSGRYRDGEIRGTWTHRVCGWKFTLIRDAS